MRIAARDGAREIAATLATVVFIFFLPFWVRGLSPFWGDLTYLHQAWRSSPAQLVQSGRAPLWEPTLYLGMPMAGAMQGGLFYPPTIVYYCFGFADATALFQFAHYFLAGWLTALWLRSLRLPWGACAGSGVCLAFGGVMVSRLPFLNHLAVLSWMPALLLFFRRPWPLAAALALMFLAGYPTFLVGSVAAAWVMALVLRGRGARSLPSWIWGWGLAALISATLAAAQLFPALELAILSRRAGGMDPAEFLRWGFSPADLRQWISPFAVPLRRFHPEVDWWKCVHIGLAAMVAIALGLERLPPRRRGALVVFLAVVALLICGDSTQFSRWLWLHLSFLRYVRYPGNLSYLALLPLGALIGAGLSRTGSGPIVAAIAAVELAAYGWISTPVAPRGLFTEAGPLVRALQDRLGPTRYLISPNALQAAQGRGVLDWKTRLYGLTNAPYRLRAVGNFGEPLVPALNYDFMDRLYSANGAAQAAAWMPWAGASYLLTPELLKATPLLIPGNRVLWGLSRFAGPVALAYQFSVDAGASLPEGIPSAPPRPGRPLVVDREREDRFSVSGAGSGWVFIAEPRYPGWRASLETSAGTSPVETKPALGAFQKIPVPEGPWILRLRYDPRSWRFGVGASLAALLAMGAYWYRRMHDVA